MDQVSLRDSAILDRQPGYRHLGPILFLLAVMVLLHGFALLRSDFSLQDREFLGTDTYSRMVRVQSLLETGDWFDPTYRRVNPPLGHLSHWSRPMDAAILAGTKVLNLHFDEPDALYWAGVGISPFFQLMSLLVLVFGMRPLFGHTWATLCGLLFLVQPPLLQSFIVGRPDHQSMQLFLVTLALVAMCHILLHPFSRFLCYAVGALFALSLWTSVETILAVAGATGGLTIAWVIWRRDFARKGVHISFSALLATLLALFLERGPRYFGDMALEVDRLSLFHVILFALALLFWAAPYYWDRTRAGESGLVARGAVVAAAGILVLALLWVIQPTVLAGKVAAVDPLYLTTRARRLSESQPILSAVSLERFGTGVSIARFAIYFGYALVGGTYLLFLLLRPSCSRRKIWVLIASTIGTVVFFSILRKIVVLRDAPMFGLVLLFPYTSFAADLYGRFSTFAGGGAAVLRAASLVALVLWPHAVGRALGGSSSGQHGGVVIGSCPLTKMTRYLGKEARWRERSSRIMAFSDFGPEILYRTPHQVFSIPNHRLQTGYADTFRAMAALTDATARAIVERREVDLILLCRSRSLENYYRRGIEAPPPTQSIFRERLLDGQIPAWLQPVPLPDSLEASFLLLEVK